MVDSSTDMELTPSWWDSEEMRTKADQKKTNKTGKTVVMAKTDVETGGQW